MMTDGGDSSIPDDEVGQTGTPESSGPSGPSATSRSTAAAQANQTDATEPIDTDAGATHAEADPDAGATQAEVDPIDEQAAANASDHRTGDDRTGEDRSSIDEAGSVDVPDALATELARPLPDMVMIATRPDGVIAIQGSANAVDRYTEQIERALESPKLAQATQYVSMIGSSLDALPGVGEDGPKVYQFSQRAMEVLRSNNLIGGNDGVFTAAADAVGNAADGIPDWLPLPSGADLIQLQTAAVGLALHASIKNLAAAVERVEHRVDELRDLVRSGQVGEVLGHHRVITERLHMIEAPDSKGLGATDWAAVAHLHPHIVSGLERTRFFIRSRMGLTEPGRMVRSRVDAAEKLIDANLADALGLLATSEHNLAGWQRLRLDRVVRNEPDHLDSVLIDMEATLALHRTEDQAIVDDIIELIDSLMEPTGLEGLELMKRRKLIRYVEEIHDATATFARQRDLNLAEMSNADLPGFRASTSYVAERTRDGGQWAIDQVKRGGTAARRALPGSKRRSDPPLPDVAPSESGLSDPPVSDPTSSEPTPPDPPPPDPSQRSPID